MKSRVVTSFPLKVVNVRYRGSKGCALSVAGRSRVLYDASTTEKVARSREVLADLETKTS